ncbi:MAG: hypothetical protein ABGZ53_02290 [Fuerstiella sp.]
MKAIYLYRSHPNVVEIHFSRELPVFPNRIEKTKFFHSRWRSLIYTFQVKIRLASSASYVEVTARDSAQARKLIQAQYGNAVTILQTKRLG